jgi:RIO kinase 2
MKLDATIFRYLSSVDIRVLTAIEMGMKNHELVPTALIEQIAKLKRGGTFKIIQQLLKYKLIMHDAKLYDGYALTYQGYDTLAIYTFMKRNHIKGLGTMVGTGKESDIYICMGSDDQEYILKLARLGRPSFKTIKTKRDYLKHRSNKNWLYTGRLASIKEFSYMKVLHEAGFPVPTPIDHNRHAILMSVIPGCPLLNIRELGHPTDVLDKIISLAVRLAENGLVHSDYNQFNLLVSNDEHVYVIDFPQMVSIDHPHAQEFYERDMRCIIEYFYKKFKVEADGMPNLSEIEVTNKLDQVMKASGYVRSNLTEQEVEDLENIQHEEEGSSEEEIEESSVEDQDQVENQPEENQEITEDQKSSDSDSDSDEHEETAQESETGAQPDLKQKIRQQVRKQKDKQKVRRNYTKAKQKLSTKTYDSLF